MYGRPIANRCPICKSSLEFITHFFLSCPFKVEAWQTVCAFFAVPFRTFDIIMNISFLVVHFFLRFFNYGWLQCYIHGILLIS